MSTRRFLILVPLVLSLLLVQSYFWVPTYDEQARGNPARLEEYINASIGDASVLNPILSADSASSDIENLIFEGLIDRDENLRFRGRVAQSWEVTEEAFFFVNDGARVPGTQGSEPEAVLRYLEQKRNDAAALSAPARNSLQNIRAIVLIPPALTPSRAPGRGRRRKPPPKSG